MTVLVVDDEFPIVTSLAGILSDEGIKVIGASSGKEAIEKAGSLRPDAVLLDIWMPEMDGIETLTKLRAAHPGLPVIMMSGHGTIDTAVKATRLGAYDYLEKPLSIDKVLLSVSHAVESSRLRRENISLRRRMELEPAMVGTAAAIREIRQVIRKVAPTEGWVLVTGENGTGKEVVARRIHALSSRVAGPFIEVNCAAIPEELIESELFGHEKGSFTGALRRRQGKFELASGGTLFLDEIGDMSLKIQAKVLRALEERSITRIGGESVIPVDLRVIAASNKDLPAAIAMGAFREDLFYRIQVVPVLVPPLRERPGDIPLLLRYYLRLFSRRHLRPPLRVTPGAMEQLCSYGWPGNVRELKNLVERLVILAPTGELRLEDLPAPVGVAPPERSPAASPVAGPLREAREWFEREHILRAIRECGGNVSKAAELLQIQRTYLHRKLKQLGIAPRELPVKTGEG
jgi:two-component system nitrogen regulation response regulator NtrX